MAVCRGLCSPRRCRSGRAIILGLLTVPILYYGVVHFFDGSETYSVHIATNGMGSAGQRFQFVPENQDKPISQGKIEVSGNRSKISERKGSNQEKHGTADRVRKIPLILIVSMMRSGTTFTGEVFRSYPDSLYLFEPMQFLSGNVGHNNITYMNGTTRFYEQSRLHDLHARAIRDLLLCRYHEVPADVFKTSHFLYHNHLKDFYNCVRSVKGSNTLIGTKCIPSLKQKCERASAVTLKLITVRMEAVAQVMKLLPEVYVIHLVRDPRPVMFSQIKVGQVAASNVANESKTHCSILFSDIRLTKQDSCFNRTEHFHRKRYEDIARDPMGQFGGLFEFVNLTFHPNVQGRIKQIAMRKGVVSRCLYCSDKGDAMAASLDWRKSAVFSHVTKIQKQCDKVMTELKYIPASSSTELKNLSYSLTGF